MPITIQQTTKDNPNLKQFEAREWPKADMEHYGTGDIDFYEKTHVLVARNDSDEIVGMAEMTTQANIASLENILVSADHRRQGIGEQLIHAAEQLAKQNDCNKIWLTTSQGWHAVKFYKKLKYKKVGKLKKHYFGKTEYIMSKFF